MPGVHEKHAVVTYRPEPRHPRFSNEIFIAVVVQIRELDDSVSFL